MTVMHHFVPVPDNYFQVRTRVHNTIANRVSPYDPGDVEIYITDNRVTPDAIVKIKIARFPDKPFETPISKILPVREEILKAGLKAAEYFKELFDG